MIITIDGLSGSGKTDVCKMLSSKLNILYFNKDLFELAISLACIRNSANPTDEPSVARVLEKTDIKFVTNGMSTIVMLNNEDVTFNLNQRLVVQGQYSLSKLNCVKEFVKKSELSVANTQSLIVEGIDAGKNIFPNANYKFFLTADIEARAKRKFQNLNSKGISNLSLEDVLNDTIEADNNSFSGEMSSAGMGDGTVVIDTTDININDIVEKILSIVKV